MSWPYLTDEWYKDPCKECKLKHKSSNALAPSVFCSRWCERRWEQKNGYLP